MAFPPRNCFEMRGYLPSCSPKLVSCKIHLARGSLSPVRVLRGFSLAALFRQQIFVAARAEFVLAREVAVPGADRKRRRHGDVRQAETLKGPAHQLLARIGRSDALAHVQDRKSVV